MRYIHRKGLDHRLTANRIPIYTVPIFGSTQGHLDFFLINLCTYIYLSRFARTYFSSPFTVSLTVRCIDQRVPTLGGQLPWGKLALSMKKAGKSGESVGLRDSWCGGPRLSRDICQLRPPAIRSNLLIPFYIGPLVIH